MADVVDKKIWNDGYKAGASGMLGRMREILLVTQRRGSHSTDLGIIINEIDRMVAEVENAEPPKGREDDDGPLLAIRHGTDMLDKLYAAVRELCDRALEEKR